MEQRLIDANALKKTLCEEYEAKEHYIGDIMLKAIDNAPTVEYPFYAEAYQTGYEEGKNDRPKGKWENICTLPVIRKCSLCGVEQCGEQTIYDNFCPNCGADMKGGKEE